MKYRAVIFDLDGTLIFTLKDIGFYVNLILKRYSFPLIREEDVSAMVGGGLRDAMVKALSGAEPDERKIDKYTDELIEEYALNPLIDTYIYDGINKLLESLKEMGIKTAVFSNKAHPVTEKIVDKLFPIGQFEIVRGSVKGYPIKPSADGALLIAESMGLRADEVLYVGDSDIDCITAKNGLFRFIGVLWGYRTKEQLEKAGASEFISRPDQLLDFLKEI